MQKFLACRRVRLKMVILEAQIPVIPAQAHRRQLKRAR
ncbi:hypothetical protein COXBURSA331_A2070 [Coxiella burnetii RSA 331]|nr:hypothetical protein COXBURSA331_A2070 [Coxiella burnetii RSA 331]EDR35609.1 hypothetical protein COXBURSA334_0021 [Coxiella burnetii Q321]